MAACAVLEVFQEAGQLILVDIARGYGMRDGKHVILCIDDDQDVLDYLKMVLESGGYLVEQTCSAEEGLKKFKQETPDLIIVDLMMEEIDSGTSFVTEVRALGCKCPVYMLTSVGDDLNKSISGGELGVTGIFQKPLSREKLLEILGEKLRG